MTDLSERLRDALGDDYRVERELGRGGAAIVYLAHDRKHHREVAIKVLRPELAASIGAERFLREVATVAKLNHPRILGLHDSGESDGLLYYVMPYVEGESLRARLQREGCLGLEEALAIIREVADGLGHAHGQGIVHRDVKPENIMLTGGHAQISDFGIAKALDQAGADRLTETGLAVGTPAYMSPEQATGHSRMDQRSDVYSLACVLYEMLIAEPPFTGPNPQAVMLRHSIDPVPSLRTVRAAIPPPIERAIMRALAKTPADRFATTDQFVRALSSGALATVSSAVAVVARRRRVPIAIGAGVVAVAALAWTFWPWGASPAARAIDPDVVAVFPFSIDADDPALAVQRDGIPERIRDALTGGGRPRAYDLAAVRNAVSERGGGQLPAADALDIARGFGAGRVLRGSVIGSGGNLTLSATLHDVASGELVGRATVSGTAAQLDAAVRRLAVAPFLDALVGSPHIQQPDLAAHDPSALWSFYAGHTALRRGAYADAAAAFGEALASDSSLAPAAIGSFLTAHARSTRASEAWHSTARLAAARLSQVAPFDAQHVTAIIGPGYPAAAWSTATELLAAADAAAATGGAVLGVLAESQSRYGAYLARPAWRETATRALDRLGSGDGTATLMWQEVQVRVATGDTAALRALRAAPRDFPLDSGFADVLAWMVASALGDRAAIDSVRAGTGSWLSRGEWAEHLALASAFNGFPLDDWAWVTDGLARRQVTSTERARALAHRFAIAALRGEADSAGALISHTVAAGRSVDVHHVAGAIVLDAAGEAGYGQAATVAASALRGDDSYAAQCYAAINTASHGEEGTGAVARLRRQAEAERPRLRGLCATVVQAIAAQPEPRDLEQLMLEGPREPGWELGNLVVARGWLARGDTTRALAAARRRAVHPDWIVLLPAYLLLEGDLAAATGDTAGAVRAYQHYLTLRSRPDAGPIADDVTRVTSALEALRSGAD